MKWVKLPDLRNTKIISNADTLRLYVTLLLTQTDGVVTSNNSQLSGVLGWSRHKTRHEVDALVRYGYVTRQADSLKVLKVEEIGETVIKDPVTTLRSKYDELRRRLLYANETEYCNDLNEFCNLMRTLQKTWTNEKDCIAHFVYWARKKKRMQTAKTSKETRQKNPHVLSAEGTRHWLEMEERQKAQNETPPPGTYISYQEYQKLKLRALAGDTEAKALLNITTNSVTN